MPPWCSCSSGLSQNKFICFHSSGPRKPRLNPPIPFVLATCNIVCLRLRFRWVQDRRHLTPLQHLRRFPTRPQVGVPGSRSCGFPGYTAQKTETSSRETRFPNAPKLCFWKRECFFCRNHTRNLEGHGLFCQYDMYTRLIRWTSLALKHAHSSYRTRGYLFGGCSAWCMPF